MSERVRKRLTRHFLFLGKSGPTFNCYKIRYRIRRKSPNISELCRRSTDCLRSRDAGQPIGCSCVAGRGTLFLLQLIILTIGIVDLCLNIRQRNSALHLTLATVEVILTTVQMALRVVSIQTHRIQTIASDLSLSPDGNDVTAELMTMQSRFRRVLTVVGMCCILVNVVFFPIFYLFFHLGWTHLTNSVLVLCFGRAHEVLQDLIDREMVQTDGDSNRVVIYEAGQLLQEQFCLRSLEARVAYEDTVNRFLVALKNTPCYVRPDYIHLADGRSRPVSTSSSSMVDEESGTPEEHLSCL